MCAFMHSSVSAVQQVLTCHDIGARPNWRLFLTFFVPSSMLACCEIVAKLQPEALDASGTLTSCNQDPEIAGKEMGGLLCRARDKETGVICALKRIKMEREREGFPLTSIREINILLSFQHPNIVDVSEVVVGDSLDQIYMVMEFMEHDLKGLMDDMTEPFTVAEASKSHPACPHQQSSPGSVLLCSPVKITFLKNERLDVSMVFCACSESFETCTEASTQCWKLWASYRHCFPALS